MFITKQLYMKTSLSYKNFSLHKNQLDAIKTTIDNDFQNGVHYHATGSGKSWIAMMILLEFYNKYPSYNVLWICERKDILEQQFSKQIIDDRGFTSIIKKYNVIDLTNNKSSNWIQSLHSSSFWGKPFLCIINRAYLTSKEKYKKLRSPIHLIIHDECHSIENKTTQEFYKWVYENHQKNSKLQDKFTTRTIGFSATPEYIYPLDNNLTKYSIYSAYLDNVILQPKIMWFKSEYQMSMNTTIKLIKESIHDLPYKKLIVWCGMIDECISIANYWKDHFPGYKLCIDFCDESRMKKCTDIYDFDEFYNSSSMSILFCAVKHREGSDIPNIDGCIFMDRVEVRSERLFVQSLGRVLRKDKDNKKKFGLIIDINAKSSIELCNRVQRYMRITNGFPWSFHIKKVTYDTTPVKKNTIFINTLAMKEICESNENKTNEEEDRVIYTKDEITSLFIREIPFKKNTKEYLKYSNRIDFEIDMILEKNLFGNIKRGLDILEMTGNIPHVTRGSCGSSLVCYMLGISHTDPIQHNITFARFINRFRDTLPDIDIDFPHYLRDEVFLKLFQKWGDKVARISNHNYYHEKSALREAFRQCGIRKFISKYDIGKELKQLDPETRNDIKNKQKQLEGTFRGFSLHCGGIIYYPEGVPQDIILDNDSTSRSMIQQVTLNKLDVSEGKHFKIDILSSRGLSQLYYCYGFNDIDFNDPKIINDSLTAELLSRGDNIGITLAETPLMRKALKLIKPKNIHDVAICLSIIRPAAQEAKKEFQLGKYSYKQKNLIIFDDDAIHVLQKLVGCDEEEADKLRRGYVKQDKRALKILERYLSRKAPNTRTKITNKLNQLRKYGFCKAHAYSYAQLVWFLAYQKAHYPEKFWKATLKNIKSSYRKWVHLYEASHYNINIKRETNSIKSIYAVRKNKEAIEGADNNLKSLQNFGIWNFTQGEFYPNCYCFTTNGNTNFCGLVASSRMLSYGKNSRLALFVGYDKGKYIDIIVQGKCYYNNKKVIISGFGKKEVKYDSTIIICKSKNVRFS